MKYFKFFNIFLLCFIFASLFVSVANADNSKKNGYYINKNFDLIPNDKAMNKKVVLITIDDGPGKTDRDLINTLKKHNAKAIFFINGIHDKDYKSNIKMLFDEGFSIGNHTWSHANLKKSKEDTIKKEIDDNTKLIVKLTGQNPRFFRPPYGAINTFTKNLVKKEGMLFLNYRLPRVQGRLLMFLLSPMLRLILPRCLMIMRPEKVQSWSVNKLILVLPPNIFMLCYKKGFLTIFETKYGRKYATWSPNACYAGTACFKSAQVLVFEPGSAGHSYIGFINCRRLSAFAE
jgi:hypothetical protein